MRATLICAMLIVLGIVTFTAVSVERQLSRDRSRVYRLQTENAALRVFVFKEFHNRVKTDTQMVGMMSDIVDLYEKMDRRIDNQEQPTRTFVVKK